MKLIDILVRDLHKFGGWPDGAVQCHRFVDESNIDFYDKDGNWSEDCFLKYWPFAQEAVTESMAPCASETVTREQYEAALAAARQNGMARVFRRLEWYARVISRDSHVTHSNGRNV